MAYFLLYVEVSIQALCLCALFTITEVILWLVRDLVVGKRGNKNVYKDRKLYKSIKA